MKSMTDVTSSKLVWRQPKPYRMEYELVDGQEQVASLHWQKAFGSLAHAVAAEGQWTLKRAGFIRAHVTVRPVGSSEDVARIDVDSSGAGTLEITDGRRCRWVCANQADAEWAFLDASNEPIVTFADPQLMVKAKGKVQIAPGAVRSSDITLLVVLGWYLLILMAADSANEA